MHELAMVEYPVCMRSPQFHDAMYDRVDRLSQQDEKLDERVCMGILGCVTECEAW